MNELVVIVEGQTEQTFVRNQLAAHLALHNTSAWAVLSGRARKHGGIRKWLPARNDILNTLKEHRYCSTMFDYYAMPSDWPGRSASSKKPWHERAHFVERKIHEDITAAMGSRFDPKFFIPYVQLHEFEALAFADVETLAGAIAPLASRPVETPKAEFSEILSEAGQPEAINDSYETCPSRRIAKIAPAYKKKVLGPIITQRIGLKTLRERCNHFASWLARLEEIGS